MDPGALRDKAKSEGTKLLGHMDKLIDSLSTSDLYSEKKIDKRVSQVLGSYSSLQQVFQQMQNNTHINDARDTYNLHLQPLVIASHDIRINNAHDFIHSITQAKDYFSNLIDEI
ncbi:MAG: hypothetical protein MRY21_00350 [Simkaniaceae bacterium]|nr:hypothetical protein [Simkaniaceae bacterium]